MANKGYSIIPIRHIGNKEQLRKNIVKKLIFLDIHNPDFNFLIKLLDIENILNDSSNIHLIEEESNNNIKITIEESFSDSNLETCSVHLDKPTELFTETKKAWIAFKKSTSKYIENIDSTLDKSIWSKRCQNRD